MPIMRDATPTAPTHEINVTPMLDVLLVLLIIFMAAIPNMRAIDVQLPDRERTTASSSPTIVLELGADGSARINQSPVARGELAARLRAIYAARPEKVLFVKANRRLRYDAVVEAMDVARGAGVDVLGWP
jgi:biopolymer transport protein ExbD